MAHGRGRNRYSGPHFAAPWAPAADRGEQSVPAETDAQAGQIDRAEVLRVIKDQLADILEIDQDTINEGDSFAEDLHLGSLELIELVEAIEEEFGERRAGFRVEDEDLEDLKSVRDAVDYVIARL
jgi:acyl carrier protein